MKPAPRDCAMRLAASCRSIPRACGPIFAEGSFFVPLAAAIAPGLFIILLRAARPLPAATFSNLSLYMVFSKRKGAAAVRR